MELISQFTGVQEVFGFLSSLFGTLPVAVKLLIYVAFGCTIFIAVLRSIWR